MFDIASINAQDYYIRKYGSETGAPNSLVVGIQEDSLGFLWVGFTDNGLYVYDGYHFQKAKNTQLESGIIELYKNNHKELIIGSKDNSYTYTNDSLIPFYDVNGHIRGYTRLNNGDEFIGTEDGRFLYYEQGILKQNYQKSNRRIGQVVKDTKDKVWFISSTNSIGLFSNGIITNYNFGCDSNEQIWSLCADSKGNIFASSLHAVKVFKNGKFVDWEHSNKLLKPFANYIFEDSRGRIWFLHLDGISIYDHGKFQFIKENNFQGLALVSIFEDSNNIFWFGTTKGLIQLQNENCILNPFSLKAEFMLKNIFQDSKNRIWTGSVLDGLISFKNGKVNHIPLPIKKNLNFYDFYEDKEGKIWISTDNGVFVYNDHQIKHLKKGIHIPNANNYSITQDKFMQIWGSTNAGIYQLHNNGYLSYNDSLHIKTKHNNGVFEVFSDAEGEIWVLSDENLLKRENKKFNKIEIANEKFQGRKWGMVEHPEGTFWLATEQKGIIKFNYQQHFISYLDTTNGLLSNTIISIDLDRKGNIVCGSPDGLNKIETDHSGNVMQILSYNKENGLIDDAGLYKVLLSDNEENIWFGSGMGLIKFTEPQWENLNHIIPTYITHNYSEKKTDSNALVLKFKENQISFQSTGIYLNSPSSVQYLYWLEGYEKQYSSPSHQRVITYSNLKPGTYTFYVKTTLSENNRWQGQNKYTIKVLSPLWLKPWFIVLISILTMIIIYAALSIWANAIKAKEIKKEEVKRKVLELELKFLRSQMNPHFLFNSINSIQGLILSEKTDEALNYLNDFGRLIRRVLNYSEEATVTIQEEINFLNEYVRLEKLRFKNKISIGISVDDKLDLAFDRIPPMLIQPFVENAIKHGLLPKKDNGWINISFKEFGDKLLITVLDNGVGRKHHETQKPLDLHQSKGTQIIEDRIKLLKRNPFDDSYKVNIIDLYDKQNRAIGTKVTIQIPLY